MIRVRVGAALGLKQHVLQTVLVNFTFSDLVWYCSTNN